MLKSSKLVNKQTLALFSSITAARSFHTLSPLLDSKPSLDSKLIIEKVLERSKWAPSGDNVQPWRFEIPSQLSNSSTQFTIHNFDTRSHCVYDLRGSASCIALGALLENIELSCGEMGLSVEFSEPRVHEKDDSRVIVQVSIRDSNENIRKDDLSEFIEKRCVNRRPFSTKALTPQEKQEFSQSVASLGFSLLWKESPMDRFKTALFLQKNGKLRLITPEAYATHSTIIEFGVNQSKDRIPSPAVGLDPLGLFFMKWALDGGWKRVDFLNRFMGGTLLPRLQMDLLPGFFCGGHFMLVAEKEAKDINDFIKVGRALQRLWLTSTKLGLQFQPEATPVIFSNYVRNGVEFSEKEESRELAKSIEKTLNEMVEGKGKNTVFMGRVGHGKAPPGRSIRKSLNELLLDPASQ
ncbi:predicted protein [Naegleria gruberi]|uniref:Predicted protein n=1 Tax=Naegleria gruberi TaxID=5762 RepID=D2V925_NAEGR|nr:uncharacterized protein NAEGRDRAFT_65365 [Naegleria gruberi]EFC46903.1 predicted protein [Naegleria gruberi]|eukprot:XP_002679647.1 predicted protein [Naegleria gruberi strain NEG-M]